MPRPNQWDRFTPETRAAVEARQTHNGFSDIDGLAEFIRELEGADVSRSTAGYISQEIKAAAYEARKLAMQSSYVLAAMGDKLHDIAVRNGVGVDVIIARLLQANMEKSATEIASMEPEQLDLFLNQLERLTLVQSRAATASRHAKGERRETKREHSASAQNTTSDEFRRRLAEKMAAVMHEDAENAP